MVARGIETEPRCVSKLYHGQRSFDLVTKVHASYLKMLNTVAE